MGQVSRRLFTIFSLNITTLQSAVTLDTQEIVIAGHAAGTLFVPPITANNALTTLTFWTSYANRRNQNTLAAGYATSRGYTPALGPDTLYGITSGSAVAITVSNAGNGGNYPIPPCLFGTGVMMIVGNSTGIIDLCLKG